MAAAPNPAFRFFNAGLGSRYRQCPLPTLNNRESVHHHTTYRGHQRHRVDFGGGEISFKHTSWLPPGVPWDGDRHQPKPQLSRPFAPPEADEEDEEPPEQKKQRTGRRKRPINGKLRTYQVRMITTPEQRRELKRCFSAARCAYNATVNRINTHGMASFYTLRNEYRGLEFGTDEKPEWTKSVHNKFVMNAVKQAHTSASNAFDAIKEGRIDHFDLHYRSHRRTKSEVLEVEADPEDPSKAKNSVLSRFEAVPGRERTRLRDECLAFFGGNLKATGGVRLQDTHHVVSKMLAEGRRLKEGCKIRWEKRTGDFYFLYTYDQPPPAPDPDPQFETKRLVATDLGADPFATWYSPTEGGTHGQLLAGMRAKLDRRSLELDRRVSKVELRGQNYGSTVDWGRSRKRRYETYRRAKRKLNKERLRLSNWMKAAHYATANFLLRRFDVVVLPKLPTSELVRRDGRAFGSNTARAMYTWSFSKFAQRVESAAFRYSGRHVCSDATEPGTSKTCGCCGWWHAQLGGKKKFRCESCGVRMDRDVNGARNNFLAYLGSKLDVGWDGNVVPPAAVNGH